MSQDGDKTSNNTRRGPRPQKRKKALISMTATEYDEFCGWANDDGVTKSVLMHDMIGRERTRRSTMQMHKGKISSPHQTDNK